MGYNQSTEIKEEPIQEIKYNKRDYDFRKVICTPIILNQILQFTPKYDIYSLKIVCKRIYKLYIEQITKLRLSQRIDDNIILTIQFDKYENLRELNLEKCINIENFNFISKIYKFRKIKNRLDISIRYIVFTI